MALMSILRTSIGLNNNNNNNNNVNKDTCPCEMMTQLTHTLPLIDSLDSNNRVTLARDILDSIQKWRSSESESGRADPETVLYLSGILADSVNALTIQGTHELKVQCLTH